jgi:hypothetical protein
MTVNKLIFITKAMLIMTLMNSAIAFSYESKLAPCLAGVEKDNCYGAFNILGYQYIGEFKDNMPDGYGTYIFPNGDYYTGQLKRNKFNGNGTYIFADTGEKKIGFWIDSKLKGEK